MTAFSPGTRPESKGQAHARAKIALGLAAAMVAPSLPATAAGTMTVPTQLSLDDCTIVSTNDFETLRACSGYKGVPVMFRTERQQVAVSYGLTSTTEKAASELMPVNFLPGSEINWRISNRDGDWKAFAAILRFTADAAPNAANAATKPAQVLLVTRIAPGATCAIAYVDALANPDAMALAEAAADQHGFDFTCGKDQPERVGKFAAW